LKNWEKKKEERRKREWKMLGERVVDDNLFYLPIKKENEK